jgi:hypothetical protein
MSRFDDLQIEILYTIWKRAYEPGSSRFFNLQTLREIIPEEKIFGATFVALDALSKKGFLGSSSGSYWLDEKGIEFIENGIENSESTVSITLRRVGIVDAKNNLNTSIPASDRLVTLDHNGNPYREAISTLDAAITAFREDHHLENDWGPEKGILLQSLEAGQRLLKETVLRVRTAIAITLEPLRIIADRYREAIAAGLITATVDQVLPTVERAISAFLTLIGMA